MQSVLAIPFVVPPVAEAAADPSPSAGDAFLLSFEEAAPIRPEAGAAAPPEVGERVTRRSLAGDAQTGPDLPAFALVLPFAMLPQPVAPNQPAAAGVAPDGAIGDGSMSWVAGPQPVPDVTASLSVPGLGAALPVATTPAPVQSDAKAFDPPPVSTDQTQSGSALAGIPGRPAEGAQSVDPRPDMVAASSGYAERNDGQTSPEVPLRGDGGLLVPVASAHAPRPERAAERGKATGAAVAMAFPVAGATTAPWGETARPGASEAPSLGRVSPVDAKSPRPSEALAGRTGVDGPVVRQDEAAALPDPASAVPEPERPVPATASPPGFWERSVTGLPLGLAAPAPLVVQGADPDVPDPGDPIGDLDAADGSDPWVGAPSADVRSMASATSTASVDKVASTIALFARGQAQWVDPATDPSPADDRADLAGVGALSGAMLQGPSFPANSGAAPAALPSLPVPQVAAQITASLSQSADGATELALSPDELGHVRLRLERDTKHPERMVVHITFERPETMDLFRRHAGELADALRDAGYAGADIGFGTQGGGSDSQGRSPASPVPDYRSGASGPADAQSIDSPAPRPMAGASLDLRL